MSQPEIFALRQYLGPELKPESLLEREVLVDFDVPVFRGVRGNHRKTQLGEPDRFPLARSQMIRVVPRIGIQQQ